MTSKILFALILFLWPTYAFAQMAQDDIERADVATGIFNQACFSHYGQKDKAAAHLDQTFKRNTGSTKQLFLNFAKVEKGDVWIASFPKGVFAIVLSEDGNCHVLAQKADRDRIHINIAGLAADAKKNLAFKITPHEILGSATRSSGFDVAGDDGKSKIVIVASTPVAQAPDKPDAVITMAVSAY